MTPGLVHPSGRARGKRNAALENRAIEVSLVARLAPARQVIRTAAVPERTAVADARNDGQDVVEDLERRRQAMVGVEAERLVLGPASRLVAEGIRLLPPSVLRRIAGEIANAVLAFVIQGKSEDRLRIDVEVEFGQASRHRVELVEPPGDLGAERKGIFKMLPEDAAIGIVHVLALPVKKGLSVEVAAEIGIGRVRTAQAHVVAFGRIPPVLQRQPVAVFLDQTAPAVVVPPAVHLLDVIALVIGVVDAELAAAEIPKPPLQVFAEADALFVAQVEARCPIKPPFRRVAVFVAQEMITRAREEIGAPARRVARHPAEAAARVQRIVHVGQPEDRHLPETKLHVAEDDGILSLVDDLSRHVPVRVAQLVRTGRCVGRIGERHRAVRRAAQRFAAERNRS